MSIINNQYATVNTLTIPQGIDLNTITPNILPSLGKIAYDRDDPSSLYIGNGSTWSTHLDSTGVVTIAGDQTVTGYKKFDNGIEFGNPLIPLWGIGITDYKLNNYAVWNFGSEQLLQLTGPFGTIPYLWNIYRMGNMFTVNISEGAYISNLSPSLITAPTNTLPVGFRSQTNNRSATCRMIVGNVHTLCTVYCNIDGSMTFSGGLNPDTLFPDAGKSNGFPLGGISFSYFG